MKKLFLEKYAHIFISMLFIHFFHRINPIESGFTNSCLCTGFVYGYAFIFVKV